MDGPESGAGTGRARRPWLLALALAFAAGTARAQTAAPDGGVQVYDKAFFAQYQLSNAEDMLRRVPGAGAVLDATTVSQDRGLGAGTEQILIDGKRLASKSTSPIVQLRRIPAADVERVELIRNATQEVQSQGLVINVVLKAGAGRGGTGNFELSGRFSDQGWSDVDGLVSYANSLGRLSYVVGFEKAAWAALGLTPNDGANDWSVRRRYETYLYPGGQVMERRPQKSRRLETRYAFTANATYAFAGGGELRLNTLYQPDPVKVTDLVSSTRFDASGARTGAGTEVHYNKTDTTTFELGGELQKPIGRGLLNVVGLHSRTGITVSDFRDLIDATGPLTELARSANDQHKGEDVVRASYSFPLARTMSLRLGAEGARNYLTQDIQVYFDTDRDGRLERIDIPTSFARVVEKRAELFVTHNWKATPALTFDTGLYFEISRVSTNYPQIPVRTLHFWKPRIDIRYAPTPTDRFRVTVARTIGQLDLTTFVPSYNVTDLRIDLGNPLIRPIKILTYEAAYERRLAHDDGTLGLRAFYRATRDVTSFIPFGFTSTGLPQSARGNVPQSDVWGLEASASVRLSMIGLREAQVTAKAVHNYSNVTDQFSGRPRRSASVFPTELSFSFRHDLTAAKAAYGVDFLELTGSQPVTNIRNFEYYWRGWRLGAFVEKTLWAGYSIRLESYNVNAAEEDRRRLIYRISQAEGSLVRVETYKEVRDRRFVLKLRGRF